MGNPQKEYDFLKKIHFKYSLTTNERLHCHIATPQYYKDYATRQLTKRNDYMYMLHHVHVIVRVCRPVLHEATCIVPVNGVRTQPARTIT